MSVTETVIAGTLKPDGTLELDEKPNLSPGRVTVVLRHESEPKLTQSLGNDFFQMMEEIWDGQRARSHVPRSMEEVDAERKEMRGQMEGEIEASIRLQEECQLRRKKAEGESTTP